MSNDSLIGQISQIQLRYSEALSSLYDPEAGQVRPETSFSRLYNTSKEAKEKFDELVALALSPQMQQQPVAEFRCAIIGSSNHGKTSVLVDMFPDLAQRGLLITDVKDTTSQALFIKAGARSQMVFSPWSFDQIRYLVDISRKQLTDRRIDAQYREDHVEIDAEEADFEPSVRSRFKFGIRQKLKPFAGQYLVDAADPATRPLVARLTTKVDYSQSSRPQDLVVNNEGFNDLQFRVAVKSVELGSDYSEISKWLHNGNGEGPALSSLAFIDTPGLKAGGSDSDEVLRHVLAKKNQQIVVELLKNDELDLIVHLVLCGQQSDFADLWTHLEGVDSDVLQDLGDRIIIAVNGFNIYFDNPDLARRWKREGQGDEDDHFNVTIQSNILSKMSERGAISPLGICFVDVRKVIESRGVSYEDYYKERRETAESWAAPNGVGYTTLKRLNMLDRYKENLDAICDPEDCGKGFLVRQIAEAWKTQGPKLMVRRFVVRNRLLASIRDLRALILSYYDNEGRMTRQSITDALKTALSFLDPKKPDAIELFCRKELDPFLKAEVVNRAMAAISAQEPGKETKKSWVVEAFRLTIVRIFAKIKASNRGMTPEVEGVLNQYITSQLRSCAQSWGYSSVELPTPGRDDEAPRELIVHALQYHCREFMQRCLKVASSDDDLAGIMQDEDDRQRVEAVLGELQSVQTEAERLCSTYGVALK